MMSRLLTSTRLFRLDGGVSLAFGLVTAFFQYLGWLFLRRRSAGDAAARGGDELDHA